MTLLQVSGLRSGYGAVEVLHDLAFHVHPGEIVALLGANGAGKTTTLRAIAGLLPARGRIALDGADDFVPVGADDFVPVSA